MLTEPGIFLKYVIDPTLSVLGTTNQAYRLLLLGTALQETKGLTQKHGSRGLGIYNISPQRHRMIWDSYLAFRPDLASRVRGLASQRNFLQEPHKELVTNLTYATAIAYIVYEKTKTPLDANASLSDLANYWRRHFHVKASGTSLSFVENLQAAGVFETDTLCSQHCLPLTPVTNTEAA